MQATIEGAGVALAAYSHGDPGAPAVLLVHGMASDAQAWEDATRRLAATGMHAIAYDRRGYGASGAPQPFTATTVLEQSEDARAVLDSYGLAGVIVAGDGFGALVALDLLRRFPERVSGVIASDPPLLELVDGGSEVLSTQRLALEDSLRDASPAAAVGLWLGDRADAEARSRAEVAHEAFFADFAGLPSWPATRREIRAMHAPVTVVVSPVAPAHIRAASAALLGLLPDGRRDDRGDVVTAVNELQQRI